MTKYYKVHQKHHKEVYSNIQDKWEEWRKQYIKKHKNEMYCHVCGEKHKLELHHICPRHICPDKIFDENNIIVLCHSCHFRIGHLNNWDIWNPHVAEDSKLIYNLLQRRREEFHSGKHE